MKNSVLCHLDMVLVETLDNIITEKVILRIHILPGISCPLNILVFPSVRAPVINQAKYETEPILAGLGYNKI